MRVPTFRDCADLLFQITNAGLTRIVADDLLQSLVSETDFFGVQTILANWRGIRYPFAMAIFSLSV